MQYFYLLCWGLGHDCPTTQQKSKNVTQRCITPGAWSKIKIRHPRYESKYSNSLYWRLWDRQIINDSNWSIKKTLPIRIRPYHRGWIQQLVEKTTANLTAQFMLMVSLLRSLFWILVVRKISVHSWMHLWGMPGLPIILVGTKTDLRDADPSLISTASGDKIAKEIGAYKFLEVSSKTPNNVYFIKQSEQDETDLH